jgi:DNA-binding PadR family transcriptional regulator
MAERVAGRVEHPELPTTAYAILGLLTFGEQSGYDLQKLVERSVGHFFDPAKSQIYAELKRLVAAGFATERHVRQDDRPDKRMYSVTPDGERALRTWLAQPPGEEAFRSPFLIHVFFGHLMDPEVLKAQIREYRDQAAQTLAELQVTEAEIKDALVARFPYMTLRAGLSSCRHIIEWADEVLKELEVEP